MHLSHFVVYFSGIVHSFEAGLFVLGVGLNARTKARFGYIKPYSNEYKAVLKTKDYSLVFDKSRGLFIKIVIG